MNSLEALKELVKKAGYTDDIPAWVDDIKTSLKALDSIYGILLFRVKENKGKYYLSIDTHLGRIEEEIEKDDFDAIKKELEN